MPARTSDEKVVHPSVRLSSVWIVTKQRKDLSRFLYHTKDHLARRMVGGDWGVTILPEILGQPAPVGAKLPISN